MKSKIKKCMIRRIIKKKINFIILKMIKERVQRAASLITSENCLDRTGKAM